MHELPERIGKVEDLHCASCNRLNSHTILSAYKTYWDYEDAISGGATHDFLRCNGCGTGTYRTKEWCSEDQGTTTTLYPPRGGHSRQPKDWRHIPWASQLTQVYKQTITAFNSDLLTLAGAGVRLLIEGVCIEQKITDGPILDAAGNPIISRKTNQPVRSENLEGKINGMAEGHLISPQQAKHLHEIRFLGNDAAHRLDIPDVEIVNHAIDIAEHILDQVYEQPEKAKALAARTRPPKV
jgi:hypothetical protein